MCSLTDGWWMFVSGSEREYPFSESTVAALSEEVDKVKKREDLRERESDEREGERRKMLLVRGEVLERENDGMDHSEEVRN